MKANLKLLPLLLLAILALVVAGCGDDDDDSGSDNGAVESTDTGSDSAGDDGGDEASGADAFQVSMIEYAFEPDPIEVKTGAVIEVENDGSIVHNLAIPDEDVSSPDVQPGEQGEVTIDLDPGEYDAICTIGNHADLGMTTTVSVK